MRILQVMAGAEHGGAEGFFYRLVPALSKVGLEQHVIVRPYPKALDLFKEKKIPVTTAPFNRLFDFKTPKVLRETLQGFSPDIVMTWMSRASDICPKGDFVSVARLGGYYDLKYYLKADYLVGNTQDLQTYFIREGWPKDKAIYLPNFVDAPAEELPDKTSYGTGKRPKEACPRSLFQTPEDVPLILALGRLHDDKAFDVLIRALAKIPKAFLWIGGVGPREAFLKELAQKEGVSARIRFLGWQEKTSRLYQACDIYCCPSRIEPLGNVVIEGWAHRKPVVAAKSAGPASLISHEKNGLLAPLEESEALAGQINRLIEEGPFRDKVAQEGRRSYEQSFTEEKVVDQYQAFFKRLLIAKKMTLAGQSKRAKVKG